MGVRGQSGCERRIEVVKMPKKEGKKVGVGSSLGWGLRVGVEELKLL